MFVDNPSASTNGHWKIIMIIELVKTVCSFQLMGSVLQWDI